MLAVLGLALSITQGPGAATFGASGLSQAITVHCSFIPSADDQEAVVPECMGAEFGGSLFEEDRVGELAVADPLDGCKVNVRYDKMIVLVDRGGCSFEQKARQLTSKGAIAVVMANTDEDIFAMGAGIRTSFPSCAANLYPAQAPTQILLARQ
jgi:hypothetical protein